MLRQQRAAKEVGKAVNEGFLPVFTAFFLLALVLMLLIGSDIRRKLLVSLPFHWLRLADEPEKAVTEDIFPVFTAFSLVTACQRA